MRNVKKSKKADLERKKFYFLEIGLILSLAFVIFAFEWRTYESRDLSSLKGYSLEDEDIEMVIRTSQPTPPPPPPVKVIQTTLIEIVDDKIDVEGDIFINVEADESTIVEKTLAPEIQIEEEDAPTFIVVEEPPSFVGGYSALMNFLHDHINYPSVAKQVGITGTVVANFVVEEDGSISNVKLIREIGGGCDEETLRVIGLMPKWNPGKQRGKAVRVSVKLPVEFFLR